MALNQLGMGFVFTAKDLASGVIQRVESSFTRMEGKTSSATRAVEANFRQFGRGLAVFGAGIAIAGSALGLAEKAGKFEQALAAAGAAAGATAAEAELLRSAALDAGLAMTGFSAEDAARTLARLTAFHLRAGDAGRIVDQLAAGMRTFGFTATELEPVLRPPARWSTGSPGRGPTNRQAGPAGRSTPPRCARTGCRWRSWRGPR